MERKYKVVNARTLLLNKVKLLTQSLFSVFRSKGRIDLGRSRAEMSNILGLREYISTMVEVSFAAVKSQMWCKSRWSNVSLEG